MHLMSVGNHYFFLPVVIKVVIVLFLNGLVIMPLLETVRGLLVELEVYKIGKEARHRIGERLIIFSMDNLKEIWAGYCDSFIPR